MDCHINTLYHELRASMIKKEVIKRSVTEVFKYLENYVPVPNGSLVWVKRSLIKKLRKGRYRRIDLELLAEKGVLEAVKRLVKEE